MAVIEKIFATYIPTKIKMRICHAYTKLQNYVICDKGRGKKVEKSFLE